MTATRVQFAIYAVGLVALAYIVYKLSQGAKTLSEAIPSTDKLLESGAILTAGNITSGLGSIFRGGPDANSGPPGRDKTLADRLLAENRRKRAAHPAGGLK